MKNQMKANDQKDSIISQLRKEMIEFKKSTEAKIEEQNKNIENLSQENANEKKIAEKYKEMYNQGLKKIDDLKKEIEDLMDERKGEKLDLLMGC